MPGSLQRFAEDLSYNDRRFSSITGIAVFFIAFIVYLFTTSPTVYVGDSGEFITSAFCLGISHNSGYPLYGLVGKVFSMIPLGNVAFRLNLMSVCFGALTAWLTYRIILKMTRAVVPALSGALLLAFASTLWSQTACAEVYTFHAFFVALIVLLLFFWEEAASIKRLLLFVFVVGLSFANHMQTVMLAPAVLIFILWTDRKTLWNIRHLFLLSFFFILGLSIYLYLPIRTAADAAIHWGNPDTIGKFFHHVFASEHRHTYVLNKSWTDYMARSLDASRLMIGQYHIFLVLAVIGWFGEKNKKYRVFWIVVILFDTFFTVFLNTISMEITAFQIPSSIIFAILIGQGMAYLLRLQFFGPWMSRFNIRSLRPVFVFFPVLMLSMNLYQNNQQRNYTAYEYGINILRNVPTNATLLVGGDNNVFPVAYLRLVANERPDLSIYDRHNLIFKLPLRYKGGLVFGDNWGDMREAVEKNIVDTHKLVYIAAFNLNEISIPGSVLIPHGLLYRAVPANSFGPAAQEEISPWQYYLGESFEGAFYRDYLNRFITGCSFLKMGRDLILLGKRSQGKEILKTASILAYDDEFLHVDLANLYVDLSMFADSLLELNIASRHTTDIALLQNAWGYYYAKTGKVAEAIQAYKKSITADPNHYNTYNNLGLMYLGIGKKEAAKEAFAKSLSLKPDQPDLVTLMKTKGL